MTNGNSAADDLARVYEAFGIGTQARTIGTLLQNISNARRRSDCLWSIEREFFTKEVLADDPEEEGDIIEECPLSWGASPKDYVEQFRTALSVCADGGKCEAVAYIAGADEYGPKLLWKKHWVELIGQSLYTVPQAECDPRADAEIIRPYGNCAITGPKDDVSFIMRHLPDVDDKQCSCGYSLKTSCNTLDTTCAKRADAEKDAALTAICIKVWEACANFDTGEDGMYAADYDKERDREIRAILAANKDK